MRYRIWCAVVVALFVVAQGGACVNVAEGGLVDWMFNCDSREQVTACYPTTPVYETMGSDCYESTTCCQSPDPMVCPPTATYAAQPTCLQRLGSCFSPSAGSTSYRTTWKTVPVTSYRPVVSTDPVTGCPVTVMKPCTTYAWQADRRECGFFDRLFGKCDSDPGQAACCMPVTSGMPTDCNGGMVSSGCCGSEMSTVVPAPAMGVPTPAPYYAPSPPSVLTQPPAGLQLSPPPALSPKPASPTPADTRPTLKPADVPPPPAAESLAPTGTSGPAVNQPPMSSLPWNQAAPANRASTSGYDAETGPSLGPPVMAPEGVRPNPVPSPDAAPAVPAEENSEPQLLNPRDQVASLRTGQSWGYSTITWPANRRTSSDRVPPVQRQRDPRTWDESGWHSAGK